MKIDSIWSNENFNELALIFDYKIDELDFVVIMKGQLPVECSNNSISLKIT